MRQAVLVFIALAASFLTGCGGGSSSSSTTTTNTVVVSPTSLSLNQTAVASISAQVIDSSGTAVTTAKSFVFTSGTPAVATVNPTSGSICAGTWDSTYVYCTAGQTGTATITATSGGLTGTATVYVHPKVDRVVITTPSSACKSMGQTLQLTAVAYSNGTDVTSSVGPFAWRTSQSSVATVDSTGILTAQAPGATSLYASISNVTSPPVSFTTCAVQSINLHVSGSTNTSFTIAPSATQQLAADVIDTAGNTISPTLTWVSTNPVIASAGTTGLVTAGTAPGTTSIEAECSNTCNYGLPTIYSNVVQPTVSGTTASTVYVTGTSATQVIPIDTGTNAAGTAIPVPSSPNSLVFAGTGSTAYLGSDAGLITLDVATSTATQNTAIPGKVLAVSPDSNYVVVASASAVYVQSASSGNSTTTLTITGATAASFTADSANLYIAAGSTLFHYKPSTLTLTSVSLTANASDVAVLPSSAFVFLAGGAPRAISAFTTCDDSGAANFITPGTPTMLAVTSDASKVLATDSPNLDVVTRSSLSQPGCPPPITATLTSVNLGVGAFNPTRILLSSDGTAAYITSDQPSVAAFNVAAGTASAIPLANAATGLSESITLDGAQLYVGGSDNNVHRIATATANDAQQISVGFKPNLIAVRPK